MLYKLDFRGQKSELTPVKFIDFAELSKMEKQLEEMLASHLMDVIFEENPLMVIFQERQYQSEADIYALDKEGNLVIFELKRGMVGADAVLQAIGYAQKAGQWTYGKLESRLRSYKKDNSLDLKTIHQEAFNLEERVLPSEFNKRQKLMLVGNAANDKLIEAVDYWKRQGLNIDFLPYRIYQLNDQYYFEMFSLPYDRHSNPSWSKGVLFDTNASWDENSVWEMMEKSRVAAYGDVKDVINYLNPRDIVFFCHKGFGIIAAGEVVGTKKAVGDDELYYGVKFLTPIPSKSTGITKYMPFSRISDVTGKSFFWARTVKVPYLTIEESKTLLEELLKLL